MDSKERFAATADFYHRSRPSYPPESIDWIVKATSLPSTGRVLDLGAGTGLFTRLWQERGYDVLGLEPNDEMRTLAEQEGGRYAKGSGEETGLPPGSFDLAVAAQAAHWFDLDAVFAEMRRVVRPPHPFVALWNIRADVPLLREYNDLLVEYSHEYRAWGGKLLSARTIEAFRERADVRDLVESQFRYEQRLDYELFHGRAFSSSYVIHGMKDQDGFARDLRALYDRYEEGGRVVMPYDTIVFAWRVGPPSARSD
ncbi:MAG: methyltransferase domain-containing protein [Gemmatimonadetes bacterium]|nr:methyltransferase domain-containing protein [Gemmatimonadota bacterium]